MAIRLEGFETIPGLRLPWSGAPRSGSKCHRGASASWLPPICRNIPGSLLAWQVRRALIGLGTVFPLDGTDAELKILPITAGRQRKANGKRWLASANRGQPGLWRAGCNYVVCTTVCSRHGAFRPSFSIIATVHFTTLQFRGEREPKSHADILLPDNDKLYMGR